MQENANIYNDAQERHGLLQQKAEVIFNHYNGLGN
jgi:hypothetical protein